MVTATPSGASTLVYASPAVHKLARALGVSLAAVQGAGQHGGVTVEDVRVHVERTLRGQSTARAASVPDIAPLPREDFTRFGPTERRVLSRIRKRSGAVLHRNWVQIPHVTNHEDADITELESFRLGLNREHRPSGVKFTLLARQRNLWVNRKLFRLVSSLKEAIELSAGGVEFTLCGLGDEWPD